MKRILSICGGGIRGIIPAMVLEEIERVTGKLCKELFNFSAGTSTGALISAAVAAGIPASKIVEIYINRTKDLFKPSGIEADALLAFRGYEYGVEKLFALTFASLTPFGATKLNDLPIDIMLTAIAELDGKPWYFVKDNQSNARTTGNYGLAECATASGAAPTYFDSFTMSDGKKMVDGGLGVVGNPVLQACIEAFEFGDGLYDPADTVVVSLGTGLTPNPRQPKGNLVSKVRWIIDVSLDAPRHQQLEMVSRLYGNRLKKLSIVDIELKEVIDMADVGSIPKLIEYGKKLVKEINVEEILG